MKFAVAVFAYLAAGSALNIGLLMTSPGGYPNGTIFANRILFWPWFLKYASKDGGVV